MKGLLIKDFKLLKNQKQFFILMIVLSVLMMFSIGEPSFLISYLTILFSILATSTISYDVYDNGMPFLFTLPITRKAYVASKYIFGILTILFGLVVSFILAVSGYAIKDMPFDHAELLFLLVAAFLIALLLQCVSLPVQLKFGPEKSRIAVMLSYGVCFALIYGLISLLNSLGINVDAALTKLSNAAPALLIFLALVFCCAVGVISYLVSLGIMKKKQF